MLENKFQSSVIKELKERFPDCLILKNDANYIQGIPDLLILWNDKWAALECKKSGTAHRQPNQSFYIDKMEQMSFARFIFPENRKECLDELEQSFRS